MKAPPRLCAVIPMKDSGQAKQRLAGVLSGTQRQQLALAMFEDVLAALTPTRELAGILVVTIDPAATAIAARYRARISGDGARDGHTGAVAAAARRLATEGLDMLVLPGDIPLVQAGDIRQLMAVHGSAPAFTIVAARDERGSNAILCSPACAVSLRFGDDSFFPHLAAAKARGIEPKAVQLPRVALDIDTPDDLTLLLATPLLATLARTRTHALLDRWRVRLDTGIKVSA